MTSHSRSRGKFTEELQAPRPCSVSWPSLNPSVGVRGSPTKPLLGRGWAGAWGHLSSSGSRLCAGGPCTGLPGPEQKRLERGVQAGMDLKDSCGGNKTDPPCKARAILLPLPPVPGTSTQLAKHGVRGHWLGVAER